MAGINGIQGSYNNQAVDVLKDLRTFKDQWVRDMFQILAYDSQEAERWKTFLRDKTA